MSGALGSFTGQVPVTDRKSFYAFFKERLGDLYEKYDFEHLVSVTDEDAMYTAKLLQRPLNAYTLSLPPI